MKHKTLVSKQRGFMGASLAELSLVIVLGGLLIATVGYGIMRYTIDKEIDDRAKMVGERLTQVGQQVDRYLAVFSRDLLAYRVGKTVNLTMDVPDSSDPTKKTTISFSVLNPLEPTVAELSTDGRFLPKDFPSSLRYGSQDIPIAVHITQQPTGCEKGGVPCTSLEALVYTTVPLQNEHSAGVDERRVTIAANAASPGNAGGSFSAKPKDLIGKGGMVIAANPLPTKAGLIGLRVGDAVASPFLRLDGTTPMTGTLDMGGQEIINVKKVTVNEIRLEGDIDANEKSISKVRDITISESGQIKNTKNTWGLSEKILKIDGKCFSPEPLHKYERKAGTVEYLNIVITPFGGSNVQTCRTIGGGGVQCDVVPAGLKAEMDTAKDKDRYLGTPADGDITNYDDKGQVKHGKTDQYVLATVDCPP